MLSTRAAVLVCLLGSAEGYAAVRDDRVFASSRNQHGRNSTTSDHEGDMKVSLGVQADASVSELKEDMDGVQEVQTLKAADDKGLSSLGETDHKVAFAVDSFGSVTATDSIEVRRLHAKLDNLDDMYKTNLTRQNRESTEAQEKVTPPELCVHSLCMSSYDESCCDNGRKELTEVCIPGPPDVMKCSKVTEDKVAIPGEVVYNAWEGTENILPKQPRPTYTDKSVLWVIDVQNDFVYGSFMEPNKPARDAMIEKIEREINLAAAAGATIIASIDYHPVDHCDFDKHKDWKSGTSWKKIARAINVQSGGTCWNQVDPFAKNEAQHTKVGAGKKGMSMSGHRYSGQDFPPHTAYLQDKGQTIPTKGSLLHPRILQALKDAKTQNKKARVKYAFKGLHKNYESFGAVETPGSKGIEKLWTGSAMMKDLDDTGFGDCLDFMLELNQNYDEMKKNMDKLKKCFPKALPKTAFAKALRLYDPWALGKTGLTKTMKTSANGTTSVTVTGKKKKKNTIVPNVDTFVVTGLVFDFCVLETAVFLRPDVEKSPPVFVPLPETLPALAGLVPESTPDEDHPLAHRMKDDYYDWVASKYRDSGVKFTGPAPPA